MEITKKYLDELTCRVAGCAIEVHKHPGPGLLESVYEKCFVKELALSDCNISNNFGFRWNIKAKRNV